MGQLKLFNTSPPSSCGIWSKEELEMRDLVISGYAVSCSSSGALHHTFREWARSEGLYSPLLGDLDLDYGVIDPTDESPVWRNFQFEHASYALQECFFREFYRPAFFEERGPFYVFVESLRGRAIGHSWRYGFLSVAEMLARLANELGQAHDLSCENFWGWTLDEIRRRKAIEDGDEGAGFAVPIHSTGEHHKRLREWAKGEGLYVYVGRSTRWGNPDVLEKEKARDFVCDSHWLRLSELRRKAMYGDAEMRKEDRELILPLRGKALGCHCAPNRCHADNWADLVNHSPFA